MFWRSRIAVEVLIVEDNEGQSKLMVSLLKAARYIAQTAASTEEAMELLQWFHPQLILVDLQIPRMDGLEFIKRLRLDAAQRKTVIIALTAFTHHSDLQRTREAGCDGHIPKPLDAAVFLPVIREFSKGLRSSGASDDPDFLVERRDSLLGEGRDPGEAILRDPGSGRPSDTEAVQRVGLAGLSQEEAHRIRSAAEHSHPRLVFEDVEGDWTVRQTEYDALIVNHRGGPGSSLPIDQLAVPAVLITSRDWLRTLSMLPPRSFDFLIAPWDADEVLLRVLRLIGSATQAALDDASENQKRRSRVLLADDDPNVIALVREVFRQSDIECDVACDGGQALAALRERIPDVIVLDVEMPGLDGFEVLKRVRRNFVTRDLPILMLTARGQRTDVARSANDGADDYIVKPFQASELAQRVMRLISERGKRSRARTVGPKIETSG